MSSQAEWRSQFFEATKTPAHRVPPIRLELATTARHRVSSTRTRTPIRPYDRCEFYFSSRLEFYIREIVLSRVVRVRE